jgi:hypothetical protein
MLQEEGAFVAQQQIKNMAISKPKTSKRLRRGKPALEAGGGYAGKRRSHGRSLWGCGPDTFTG